MNNFQTIGLIIAACLFVASLAGATSHLLNRRAAFAWAFLWVLAAVAIARPSLTVTVAHVLGIGRGADLVFYCAILGALIALFLIYVRFRRVEREITQLVRHIALRDAEPPTKIDGQ